MEKGTMNKRKAVNGILSTFTALAMLAQGLCFSTITRTPKVNADINNLVLDSNASYDATSGTYKLNVTISDNTATGNLSVPKSEFAPETVVTAAAGVSSSYTVGEAGWYAIQISGGNGGDGGTAYAYSNKNMTDLEATASGGKGAAGYSTIVYKHFAAGDQIAYSVGTDGKRGADHSKYATGTDWAISHGGGAGTYSTITVNSTGVIVAGGGGGGGGGGAGTRNALSDVYIHRDGEDAKTTSSNENSYALATYAGYTSIDTKIATDGSNAGYLVNGNGGKSGSHYINSSYQTDASGLSGKGSAQTNFSNLTKLTSAGVVITILETDAHLNASSTKTIEQLKSELAPSLQGFNLSTGITGYFDVTGVSMNGNALSYSMSGSTLNITGINPTVTYSGDTVPKSTSSGFDYYEVTATADAGITITLSPKAGFLGGNDVPLTTTGVTLTKSGSGSVSAGSATNVNVPIADFAISTQDITITCGETVTMGDMVTNLPSTPAAADAWKYDYVTVSGLTGSISPKVTTTYTDFEVSISPKTSTPTSTIGATATAKTAKGTATCYVDHTVSYQLTNIEAKSSETVKAADDFSTTIKASTNYELPETITVKVGSTTLAASEYTYTRNADKTEGTIAIVRAKITDNVQISAIGYVPEDVISVTVEWNDMSFDLTRTDTWNPESHNYGEAHVTTEPSAIKVTNNSSIRVLVELSYTPNTGYESLTGSFTWDNTANPTPVSGNAFTLGKGIPDEQAETVYFCLNGSLDREDGEDLNCGKITVSLSKVTG